MATSGPAHDAYQQRAYPGGLSRLPDRNRPQNPATQTPYAPQPPSTYPPRTTAAAANPAEEKARLERDGGAALAQLSEEQREEVDQAFQLFDMDRDRRIDYHELKVAMKALGFDVPKSDILAILQSHGAPSTPSPDANSQQYTHPKLLLGQQAFQQLMAQRILARDPRDEILRAFDLFDEGGKGKIALADLRRVARELGEGLQEEELVAMIEEFDLDGDGCIDREEFLGICLG